jgi:hypothetical protein
MGQVDYMGGGPYKISALSAVQERLKEIKDSVI